MIWLALLPDIPTETADMVRAALLTIVKQLILRTLRAAAKGFTFFADFLEAPKKEKGLNVVRC